MALYLLGDDPFRGWSEGPAGTAKIGFRRWAGSIVSARFFDLQLVIWVADFAGLILSLPS
jgi:hypothetical protein